MNKQQQQNMYADFVRRMPSGDEYNSQVKTVAAKNTTMHAVNPVYQNDAFDESVDDKDTTDYVVMNSPTLNVNETENTDYVTMNPQARQSNIDETENTDYVTMNPQFNIDELKAAGSPETKKVTSGSSKSVDIEKAASEDNVNHQSRQMYADDIKLLKNPVDA